MGRLNSSTFCRLNFVQALQLLFNFILLSTVILVVSNSIFHSVGEKKKKRAEKADEKWVYMFTKYKQFEFMLFSTEVKTICSAEFQIRAIYDQSFSFSLHDRRSVKMGEKIITVSRCPENNKTEPVWALLGFFNNCIVYTRLHLKTIQKLGLLQNMVTDLLHFGMDQCILYTELLST